VSPLTFVDSRLARAHNRSQPDARIAYFRDMVPSAHQVVAKLERQDLNELAVSDSVREQALRWHRFIVSTSPPTYSYHRSGSKAIMRTSLPPKGETRAVEVSGAVFRPRVAATMSSGTSRRLRPRTKTKTSGLKQAESKKQGRSSSKIHRSQKALHHEARSHGRSSAPIQPAAAFRK
jgi:hypothetical protein